MAELNYEYGARLMTFDDIFLKHIDEIYKFTESVNEDMDYNLYCDLFDYYCENNDIPYGTASAESGDPMEWVCERFYNDLGDVLCLEYLVIELPQN